MPAISDKATELSRKVAEAENSDIYLYNGPINENGYGLLVRALKIQHPQAILVLSTYGGSANSGYRIARFFQSFYQRFATLIFSYCKSAGTLVVTGSHRLMMSEVSGELGPLDVQLSKRDELWERRSGLLLRSALASVKESAQDLFRDIMIDMKELTRGSVRLKLASEIALQMTQGLFAPIYSQITPEGLGEDWQELHVALEYGKRLATIGGLIDETAIHKLVHDYPSHDFVIDKREAHTLFRSIDDPSSDMYALATELGRLVFSPSGRDVTVELLSRTEEAQTKTDEKENDSEGDVATEAQGGSDPAAS